MSVKSSLCSPYYAEACSELRGPSPQLSAWATQLRSIVATVVSRWRHCDDLTGPGIEPQTSCTDSVMYCSKFIIYIYIYKIRPEPSCFGITSLISDANQGEPHRKPHNKITQSGVWAFNTVKRRIAVAKEKKIRQMELARLISRKTKKTL